MGVALTLPYARTETIYALDDATDTISVVVKSAWHTLAAIPVAVPFDV
jgi:hypothetical protein